MSYQMFLKARTSGDKPQKPIQRKPETEAGFLHLGPSSSSRMITASAPKRHWGTTKGAGGSAMVSPGRQA